MVKTPTEGAFDFGSEDPSQNPDAPTSKRPAQQQPPANVPPSKKEVGRPAHPTGDEKELMSVKQKALASSREDFDKLRKREWPVHVKTQIRLGNVEAVLARDAEGRTIRRRGEVTLRDGSKRDAALGFDTCPMPKTFVPEVIRPGSQDPIVRRLVENLLLADD